MNTLGFTFNSESLKVVENDRTVKEKFMEEGVERLTHDTFGMKFPEEADFEECANDVAEFLRQLGFEEEIDYKF